MSLRSISTLVTGVGARQQVRSNLTTRSFLRTSSLVNKATKSRTTVNYSTTPTPNNSGDGSGGGPNPLLWIGCISLGAAYTYYAKKQAEKKPAFVNVAPEHKQNETQSKQEHEPQEKKQQENKDTTHSVKPDTKKNEIDYQAVYNDIAELLDSNPDYDDGSYGPVLLRLAWHSSGTFNKEDKSGGSSGGTMRFRTEATHAANNGLQIARDLLEEKIKPKYPEISYGDMYTIGGVVAVQELGGPDIKWRPGRKDQGENLCSPDGRLPDGSKKVDHVREVFYRMGFNDQEIVALTGAHVLGRCHLDRSGYDGPWQEAPTLFSNDYYKVIMDREWVKRELPDGLWQWVDKANPEVMMLPIEVTMLNDEKLKPYYELYAKDMERFYSDFAKVFKKLIELGVVFKGDEKEYVFERVNL